MIVGRLLAAWNHHALTIIVRDALIPWVWFSGFAARARSMRYSAAVWFARRIFLGCCRPQEDAKATAVGVAFSSNFEQHGEWCR